MFIFRANPIKLEYLTHEPKRLDYETKLQEIMSITYFQELMTLSTDDAFSSLLLLLADQISSSVSYLAVRKKKRG